MSWVKKIRIAAAALLVAGCMPLSAIRAQAQDDSGEKSLGDVARDLRKKNGPAENVIDDDNLPEALKQIDNKRAESVGLTFLMAGDRKGFQVAAPDVTCSLSFNVNAKALLSSSQYAQMELPASEVSKLTGPATMEGDALTVSVFNGTDWHVSELAVALTVVRKNVTERELFSFDPATGVVNSVSPISGNAPDAVRPEKKPDLTRIYRMRAAAPPLSRAVFSAPLNLDLTPGDEWHSAIVEARGYPPQSRVAQSPVVPATAGNALAGDTDVVPSQAGSAAPQRTPASLSISQ